LFENIRLNRKSGLRPNDLLKDGKVTSSKYSVLVLKIEGLNWSSFIVVIYFFLGIFVVIYLLRAFKCHFNKKTLTNIQIASILLYV
jgi:uncharacterized membrane protein